MEMERKMLLKELNSKWTDDDIHDISNIALKNPKFAKASEKSRKQGNALFFNQRKHNADTHKAILSLYCKSIALAPTESQELAFGYGNRSYLLLHIQKYEDSLRDIDRALKMTISDVLRAKLLCRKAECLKKLGSSSEITSILETAQDLTDKIDGQDKLRLLEMIERVKTLIANYKPNVESHGEKRINDLPLTEDYSSRVSIEYSKKYGRHLVAAKDYKPGDIIFVEKLYASAFEDGSSLLACDYCLKPVWSSISCDHCNWSMYCSEDCKEKAWNAYHDVECSVISFLKQYFERAWKVFIMPVRVLITAIKETISIENLRKELKQLDLSPDVSYRNFLKNGPSEMNSIKNIYTLSAYAPYDLLQAECTVVPLILISLAKYTKLFNNLNLRKIEDLAMNEDFMFLGSFLIKIIKVLSSNACGFPYDKFKFMHKQDDLVHFDDTRCLSALFSLLNHSCFPSAEWRCIEQNKIFLFALQPIKINSQIFINYGYSFENDIESTRQEDLLEKYNFMCDCPACLEKWPPIIINNALDQDKLADDTANYMINGKFSFEHVREVRKVLEEGRQIDKSHIEKLSLIVSQCITWKQPSPMFYSVTNLLKDIFTIIYSPKSLLFHGCY